MIPEIIIRQKQPITFHRTGRRISWQYNQSVGNIIILSCRTGVSKNTDH